MFHVHLIISFCLFSQELLGLSRGTDGEDCVYLVDGHKVLSTIKAINSMVDNGPEEKITTQVWAFACKDAHLSRDFIQGTQDFSDSSFIRGVDFSKPQEAEALVNSFVDKTSDGKMKNVFNNLNPSSSFLFISSFSFKGLPLLGLLYKILCCHNNYVPDCSLVVQEIGQRFSDQRRPPCKSFTWMNQQQ